MMANTLTFLLAMSGMASAATQYNMVKEHHGSGFFNDWTFYNHYDDLTNGDTIYVGSGTDLTHVDSNTNRAIIKVDNTSTIAFNDKRNSVRITSKASYGIGSLWIADLYHVPFGCSVWPAWWSQASNWPTGGEIDTFEGVNQVTLNQMSLHTTAGCTQVSPQQSSTLINTTNCDHDADNNSGCSVATPTTKSYGQAFSDAGGGVFVTEFAESGISVWFFTRAEVPATISGNSSSINTGDFGLPVANWPSGGCNIDDHFDDQKLIFDIALCGDFAGNSATFAETCTGFCYDDYVIGPPSTYDNAYFDVDFVRVFRDPNAPPPSSSAEGVKVGWLSILAAVLVSRWMWIL